jgi:hypothetical protein
VKDHPVVVYIGVVMMELPVALMEMHLHIAAIQAAIQTNQCVKIVRTTIAVGSPRRENGKRSIIRSTKKGNRSDVLPGAADGCFR